MLFLCAGTWYDMKSKTLPVWFLCTFGLIGIFCNLLFAYQSMGELLFGGMFGLLFLVQGKVTKESIGYGDGLGIMILGIFQGTGLLPVLFLAFGFSGGYGVWRFVVKKASKEEEMPFFPFLLFGELGVLVL